MQGNAPIGEADASSSKEVRSILADHPDLNGIPPAKGKGIGHDISTMAKLAIRNAHAPRDAEQTRFDVIITGKKHDLKLHIGPGDTAAPVLTLMLPYED